MPNKPRLYLETSVISYLVGRLSKDMIILFRQLITREWWDKEHDKFDLYVSSFVREEIAKGDVRLREVRLNIIKDITQLGHNKKIATIAEQYIEFLKLPPKATIDAFHLATASYYEMDYLLTWNLTHLANRIFVRKYEEKNSELGLSSPVICTPEDLLLLGE
jgi:predicted nucleic acid-binding protein